MQNHKKMKYGSVQTDLNYVPLKKRGKKKVFRAWVLW